MGSNSRRSFIVLSFIMSLAAAAPESMSAPLKPGAKPSPSPSPASTLARPGRRSFSRHSFVPITPKTQGAAKTLPLVLTKAAGTTSTQALAPSSSYNYFPYGYTTILNQMKPMLSQAYVTAPGADDQSYAYFSVDSDGKAALFLYAGDYVGWVNPLTNSFLECDAFHPAGHQDYSPGSDFYYNNDIVDCYDNGSLDSSSISYNLYYDTGETLKSGSYWYYRSGKPMRQGSYWFYDNDNSTYLYTGSSYIYYPDGNYFSTGSYAYHSNGNYLRPGSSDFRYSNGNYLKSGSNMYYLSGNYLRYGSDEYRYPSGNIAGDYNFSSGFADLYWGDISHNYLKHDTYPGIGPIYRSNGSVYINPGDPVTGYQNSYYQIPNSGGWVDIVAETGRDILLYTLYDGSVTHLAYESRIAPKIPSAPGNVTLSAVQTKSATMSWNSGSGVEPYGFRLKFQTSSSGLDCSSGQDLQYVFTTNLINLSPGTTYYYALCGYNENGTNGPAATGSFTTLAAPLAPKNPVVVTATFQSLTVGWTSGGGTTSDYIVKYAAGSTAPSCSGGTVVTGTQFTASSLVDDTTYAFGVCARSSDGTLSSQLSFTAKTTVKPRPFKPTVGGVTALSDSSLKATWVSGNGSGDTATVGYIVTYAKGNVSSLDCTSGNAVDVGSATQYVINGLEDNTTYSFGVCAYNQYGFLSGDAPNFGNASGTSLSTGITQKIPKVTAVSVSNVRPLSFVANWASGGGSTSSYGVKVLSDTFSSATCTGLSAWSGNSYSFAVSTDNAPYTFVICAQNSYGHYSDAYVGNITTPFATPPNAPSNLAAFNITFRSAAVSWTNGGGTTEYFRVAYAAGSVAPNCQTGTEIPASQTSFTTPNNLVDETDYSFSVCARYENKFSPQINLYPVHTLAKPRPPVPLNVTATVVFDSEIDLSWSSGGGTGENATTGYRYYAVKSTDPDPADCASTGAQLLSSSTLSARVHPLLPGTSYRFGVCAVNQYGFDSKPTQIVMATTNPLTAPPAVANLTNTFLGDTEATFTWQSGGGNTLKYAVGYQQGALSTMSCTSGTSEQTGTSFSVTTLAKDFDYTFVVCAKSESGAYSDPTIVTVHTISGSPAPSNFHVVSKTDGSVQLDWDPATPLTTQYKLAMKLGASAPGCAAANAVQLDKSVTDYEWKGLQPSKQYSFALCGYNVGGVASRAVTVTVTTDPLTLPPQPNLAVTEIQDTFVRLSWDPAQGNTDQFRIAKAAGSVAPSCSTGGTLLDKSVTSYTFSALKANQAYTFALCGISASGNLSPVSSLKVTTKAASAPSTPMGFALVSKDDSSIAVSWNAVGGNATQYRIVSAASATAPACSTGGTVLDPSVTSYLFKSLKASTTYSISLCALNGTGLASTKASLSVKTDAPTPPPVPTGYAVDSKTDWLIKLRWDAGTGNTVQFRLINKVGTVATTSCSSGGTLLDKSVTSYVFKNLLPSKTYTVTLCALSGSGASSRADVQVTTDPITPPPAPVGLAQVSDGNGVTSLKWQWSSGLGNTVGYYVAFSTGIVPNLSCQFGTEKSVTEPADPVNTPLTYQKTGLASDKDYTVSVCARSASGVLSPAVVSSVRTARPAPVSLLQMYNPPTSTAISAQWVSGGLGATAYSASISLGTTAPACGAGGVYNATISPATKTFFTKTGLKANTQYSVTVCAKAANGTLSDPQSIVLKTEP